MTSTGMVFITMGIKYNMGVNMGVSTGHRNVSMDGNPHELSIFGSSNLVLVAFSLC